MKDEIKIGQVIEKELDKEEQFEINKAIKEDLEDPDIDKADAKNIIISVIVIIGLFGLIFGGATFYNGLTSAAVIDVDQLHQDNLEGDLNEKEGYVYNGYSYVTILG